MGNEILRGSTINSNATFISREMASLGLSVHAHRVLSDNQDILKKGFSEALKENDVVICTGGLGPTLDDITKDVAVSLFESTLIFDKKIAEDLEKRYGSSLPSLEHQATVPTNAIILANKVGTAPGFIFEKGNKWLVLLPGVPLEMKEMFQQEFLPHLKKRAKREAPIYRRELHFFRLPEVAVDPILRKYKELYPEVDFGIYPSLGLVTVSMSSLESGKMDLPYHLLKETFKEHIYESQTGRIEESIHEKLIAQKKTLSLAESCTGGALAATFTAISGASNYFKGGVIAYCNTIKEKVLSVADETLKVHGAVSEETTIEMAEGALKLFSSDISIAISGVAGPGGGSREKPVGTVCVCIAFANKEKWSWTFQASGTRAMIVERSIHEALGVLYSKL